MTKEMRLLNAIDERLKSHTNEIQETLVSYRNNPATLESPLHQELIARIDGLEEKIDPILEALNTAGNLKKALLWFSAVILAISGSGFGIITIYHWIKNV